MQSKTNRRTGRALLCVVLCVLMTASTLIFASAEGADLTVLGKEYSRVDIVALEVTEGDYTYSKSGGQVTDSVRGVLIANLLKDTADDAIIDFATVDSYDVSSYSMTKAALVEKNAIIAYAIKTDGNWVDYVKETKAGTGVFALYVDDMKVVGAVSSIALAEKTVTPDPGEIAPDKWIGDATPDKYDVKIVGMVKTPAYFTIGGFSKFCADYAKTGEYKWMNKSQTTDIDTFTGIYIEDLAKLFGVSEKAQYFKAVAKDGVGSTFSLGTEPGGAYWTDPDGNKMILAWNGTISREDREIADYELPKIAIGQKDENDINRQYWTYDIVEINFMAFNDLGGFDWAASAINALYETGVVKGTEVGKFNPSGTTTRAMAVTVLGRLLNPGVAETGVEPGKFPDVDYSAYYGVHVEWAVEKGIIKGYEDGTFQPDTNLTVAHLLIIAERAGLLKVPEGIDPNVDRPATRAELAVVLYALAQQ